MRQDRRHFGIAKWGTRFTTDQRTKPAGQHSFGRPASGTATTGFVNSGWDGPIGKAGACILPCGNLWAKFQERNFPIVMPADPPFMPMSELPTELPQAGLLAALARFERPLVRYAWGLCGDLEQARDAVQDTFIKLSRDENRSATPATSDQIEALAPWLFTVCKNRVIDLHRKSSRLVSMDTAQLESTPAVNPTPDAALDRKDTARQLRALIAELPEKQRHVLKLKFEAGLSYKEIAAVTGLTTSNIGWIIHQAVQSLRGSWEAMKDL
jgi:RNA polymerase sigma factor (sigma-70 family)